MNGQVRVRYFKVGACRHPECFAIAGGRWCVVDFPFIAALIEHPSAGLWLFDTGYSDAFIKATSRFPYSLYRRTTPLVFDPAQDSLCVQMRATGFDPDAVKGIVLSHLHADHMAGVMDFPNATVYASKKAYEHVMGLWSYMALKVAYLKELIANIDPKRLRWIEDLACVDAPKFLPEWQNAFDLIGDQSLLLHGLPGHARGQYGLTLQTAQQEPHFLVADAIWNVQSCKEGRGAAFVTGLLHDSQAQYRATFAALHRVATRGYDPVRLVPSHCSTTLDALQSDGLLELPYGA